jgi:hypothetical protein
LSISWLCDEGEAAVEAHPGLLEGGEVERRGQCEAGVVEQRVEHPGARGELALLAQRL